MGYFKNHLSYNSLIILLLTIILTTNNLPSAHAIETSFQIVVGDQVPVKEPTILMEVVCETADDKFRVTSGLKSGEVMNFTYTADPDLGIPTALDCIFNIGPTTPNKFRLFDYERDVLGGRCGDQVACTWEARPDGVYEFYNSQYNLMYNWSSK